MENRWLESKLLQLKDQYLNGYIHYDRAGTERLLKKLSPISIQTPFLRVGGSNDGGYLVPDLLEGTTACFSPGVAETADFELELAQLGIPCFLADASVSLSPVKHALVHFDRVFLGPRDTPGHTKLSTWVDRYVGPNAQNLLLQMDIEGAEYDVINAEDREFLKRFKIIVLELHHLPLIWLRTEGAKIRKFLYHILSEFEVIHLHQNNFRQTIDVFDLPVPEFLEVTLLRRDLVIPSDKAILHPHPLDAPNIPEKPDYQLPDYLING